MKIVSLLFFTLVFILSACNSTPLETGTEVLVPLKVKPNRTVYRAGLPKDSWVEFSFILVDDGKGKLKPADIKLVNESSSEFLSLADHYVKGFEKWRYSKKKITANESTRFILKLMPPKKEATARCNANNECKLNSKNEQTVSRWFYHLNKISALAIACDINSGVGYTHFQREYRLATNKFKQHTLEKNPTFDDQKLQKVVSKAKRKALNKMKKTIIESPKTCDLIPKTLKTLKSESM